MTKILKSGTILAILGIVIWWMGSEAVWLGDDLDYKFRMQGAIWQSWGWIQSPGEFLESQWVHYLNVNGRIIAHSLVQLFNGVLGQQVFAVCNALMYILFAIAISKAGNVSFRKNPAGLLTATCMSVLFFVTKMMPTCQIGYIWGMTVNLLWLVAFYGKTRPTWTRSVVLALTGIIVGNWQESISIGVCAALGIWWIGQFFDRRKTFHTFFDWRRSWAMLGYIVGTASNCLSPSTIGRVGTVQCEITDQLLIASYSIPAIIILVIAAVIVKIRQGRLTALKPNDEEGKIPYTVLVTSILVLLAFNSIIGVYSNRQLFGANLFAAILTLRILPKHRFNNFFNILFSSATILLWGVMATGILEVKEQYRKITELYEASPKGTVEINRERVMTIGHPSAAKYQEDIVGQFDNDLHHSLMKDFKHTRGGKTLKLVPATIPDKEKTEQYAPGHFNVTVKMPKAGEQPREILVYGHYSIMRYLNIPASPRRLQLLKYSRKRGSYGTAVIIPEYPLFTADSIIIL